MRRIAASVLAVALTVTLAACSDVSTGIAEEYKQGTNQGFISGDGRVEEIAATERGEAVEFTGTAIDGSTISSADYAGEVLVLNFWYAACGPCRIEAPILQETYETTAPDGAQFLGVNIYDGPEQATSFEEKYAITYPSLLAREDADLKLSFVSWTSLTAAPTTLVLDTQGRVAARIFGAVPSESILRTIVTDTIAEEL